MANGTRQACPLSPQTFALSLEPLLNRVRQNPDIQGVRVGQCIHKVAEYADDLLFSMSYPHISLPNLVGEIEKYGTLSNLKIHHTKSEAMSVAMPYSMQNTTQLNFGFRWGPALKYLGTHILAKENYTF